MKKIWAMLLLALVLCLLPGMMRGASADTGDTIYRECSKCHQLVNLEVIRYTPADGYHDKDKFHWAVVQCPNCKEEYTFTGGTMFRHSGGTETPTCTTGKTCEKCGAQYGILGHEWGAWVSNGDGTHTHTCMRNGCDATETENCSGDNTATCVTLGTCTACGGQYYGGHNFANTRASDDNTHWYPCVNGNCQARKDEGEHWFIEGNMCLKSAATCVSKPEYYENCAYCHHKGTNTYFYEYGTTDPDNHAIKYYEAKAPTCTQVGWNDYKVCQREGCGYSTYAEIPATGHSLTHHAAKAATCTEPGWAAYDTCSKCSYSTYQTLPALGHDLIHHEAQAATCTEIGWEAYDTCSRCNYTTYVELPALGHDLIHHEAQAATCTEIGWKAYDTCSRCDYTTYVELPALGHDYQAEIIPRTCEDDGYTLHTCSRCADSYADTIVPHCGHWYGEWSANGDGAHAAACLRGGCHYEKTVDCEIIELPSLNVSLCPVCGTVSDGSKLALTSASVKIISGRIPHGEALLRVGTLASGEKLLTVGYVYGGQLSKASCQVKITLPAELLNGYNLSLLNADGTETPVDCTIDGDSTVFTLTFAQPLLAVHLVPAQ